MKLVGNVVECEKVMTAGWRNRSVGATLMNADSSRSHSIFTIYLEACDTGDVISVVACFLIDDVTQVWMVVTIFVRGS